MWNRFMTKLGWRDDRSAALRERVREFGLEAHPIETFFDLLDFDEGRDPVRRRAWELRPAQRVVIMGVAGSGKTTVGARLAAELGWRFADADDFHPPENVAKMAAGIPLDDADRAPWIAALAAHADDAARRGDDLVLACSALRAAQRDRLVTPHTTVVYLRADSALLHRRLAARTGHFMKATMLDSQLAALEEPTADRALIIDAAQSADAIVATVRAHLER
jgi:carbohydrate kinase (thermoresistant glucokinase family)